MSKEDASSGLLSKVVKFVRNPATSWSDLDHKETSRDEALSKQLLKEMIERKRRNDFVRKREFDMLRKIRKQEAALIGHDLAAKPSFFQSSLPSKLDDRANTIKKIDEIEAQMSMQWWKTKTGNSTGDLLNVSSFSPSRTFADSAPPKNSVPFLDNALPGGYAVTTNDSFEEIPEWIEKKGGGLLTAPGNTILTEEPVRLQPMIAGTSNQGAQSTRAGESGLAVNHDTAMTEFLPSDLMPVEDVSNAELNEASICFANGDDVGAEADLLRMLAPDGTWIGHIETWMTLFDFYRATHLQDKFESKAIEFVQRFDRSAPQWFAPPEMVGQPSKPVGPTSNNGPTVDWICPSTMSFQTVIALTTALAKAAMPWRVDWSNLKVIDMDALKPLCHVFNNWATSPVQLRFIGYAQFQGVIEVAAPLNQRQIPKEWWYLRMAALRITHRPDEFELAALDFCVTYEVSPPSWESARCDYKRLDVSENAPESQTSVGDDFLGSVSFRSSSMDGDTEIAAFSYPDDFFSAELSGQMKGDALDVIHQLEVKLMGANMAIISCANLIRVDFSSAGTLLNWVSTRQANNQTVQFVEVNRLVATFFNVIGISEHARITIRAD